MDEETQYDAHFAEEEAEQKKTEKVSGTGWSGVVDATSGLCYNKIARIQVDKVIKLPRKKKNTYVSVSDGGMLPQRFETNRDIQKTESPTWKFNFYAFLSSSCKEFLVKLHYGSNNGTLQTRVFRDSNDHYGKWYKLAPPDGTIFDINDDDAEEISRRRSTSGTELAPSAPPPKHCRTSSEASSRSTTYQAEAQIMILIEEIDMFLMEKLIPLNPELLPLAIRNYHSPREYSLLRVEILNAVNLKNCDLMSLSDPYVRIKFEDRIGWPRVWKSSVIRDCLNPTWDDAVAFFILARGVESFQVELFDEDGPWKSDDALGHVTLPLGRDFEEHEDQYELVDGADGKVQLKYQQMPLSVMFKNVDKSVVYSKRSIY